MWVHMVHMVIMVPSLRHPMNRKPLPLSEVYSYYSMSAVEELFLNRRLLHMSETKQKAS